MIEAFPDTSFLCAYYRLQDNSVSASRRFSLLQNALPLSDSLLFEFRQSIRFQVWLNKKDATKGFPMKMGKTMLESFDQDVKSGEVMIMSVEWPKVLEISDELSMKHTLREGNRSMDILQVATAVYLGANEFLSFDVRQQRLAQSAGMLVTL